MLEICCRILPVCLELEKKNVLCLTPKDFFVLESKGQDVEERRTLIQIILLDVAVAFTSFL